MQAPSSFTPCQSLQQAWTEFNSAISPEAKTQKQMEMIKLLKDQILGFGSHDADNLREIADSMKLNFHVDPELTERVAELANRLAGLSLGSLPNEMMVQALALVPPINRFGLHCSNRMWGAESRNPAYLEALVNKPDHPIPLNRLPLLLAKCGGLVLHLDCARLLTHDDRQKMTGDQLAALVRLCPNLQSLTLYKVDDVSAEQLIGIVNLTPALRRLNIAGCLKMAEQPSQQTLQASCPHLAISFLSYSEVSGLLSSGFPFDLFCQISDEKRTLFTASWIQMAALRHCRGFNYEALAQLSCMEIAWIVEPDNARKIDLLCIADLNFAKFCKLPFRTKQLLLEDQVYRTVRKLLDCEVSLDQILALPSAQRVLLTEKPQIAVNLMRLGFTWDELIALPWDNRQIISEHAFDCSNLLKKGVPLQKLAQLELPLLQTVLGHQWHISTYLDAGMDFETICILSEAERESMMRLMPFGVSRGIFLDAGMGIDFNSYNNLPEAVRQRVNRHSTPIASLIKRGEKLETVLRLTEEELTYLVHNLNGFYCTGTLLINVKNLPTVISQGKSVANDAMERVFNMRAQSEEQIKVQMQSHTMTFIYEGIPLSRFVELQGALREKVLKHSDTIGEKIRAGMDFEAFLKLPGDEQDTILNKNPRL